MKKDYKVKVEPSGQKVKLNYRCQTARIDVAHAKEIISDLAYAVREAERYEPTFGDKVADMYLKILAARKLEGIKRMSKMKNPENSKAYKWVNIDQESLKDLVIDISKILDEFNRMESFSAVKPKRTNKKQIKSKGKEFLAESGNFTDEKNEDEDEDGPKKRPKRTIFADNIDEIHNWLDEDEIHNWIDEEDEDEEDF